MHKPTPNPHRTLLVVDLIAAAAAHSSGTPLMTATLAAGLYCESETDATALAVLAYAGFTSSAQVEMVQKATDAAYQQQKQHNSGL